MVSSIMIYKENSSNYINRLLHLLHLKNSQKIMFIVLLYSFINVLSFHTLGLLNAAVYTILIQLKVLTTAFFGVYINHNHLSMNQWYSLFHLVMGSILIVGSSRSSANVTNDDSNVIKYAEGIFMVFVIVIISGYAAVSMERIFKTNSPPEKENESSEKEKFPLVQSFGPADATPSVSPLPQSSSNIWERNFQLSFFSMLLMLTILIFTNMTNYGSSNVVSGPFSNWSIQATIIVLLQGCGGLLAAATLKFTNANTKTLGNISMNLILILLSNLLYIYRSLATTLSIVNSTILEYLFMGLHLNLSMIVGIFTIIASISSFTLSK